MDIGLKVNHFPVVVLQFSGRRRRRVANHQERDFPALGTRTESLNPDQRALPLQFLDEIDYIREAGSSGKIARLRYRQRFMLGRQMQRES
jgi:hypothetical protein